MSPLPENIRDLVRAEVRAALSDPIALPQQYKSWLGSWLEINQPAFQLSQLQGWAGYVGSNGVNQASAQLALTTTEQAIAGVSHTLYASARYLVNATVTALRGTGVTSDTERLPTATATSGGAGDPWNNPNNAQVQDGVSTTVLNSTTSAGLLCTTFGFSIGSAVAIQGFEVRVRAASDLGAGETLFAQLLHNGVAVGSEKSAAFTSTSLINYTFGGSTDLWGTTLTNAQVSSSTFGVRLRVTSSGSSDKRADVVGIKIFTDVPWTTITVTPYVGAAALAPPIKMPYASFGGASSPLTSAGTWQAPPGALSQALTLKAAKDSSDGGGTIETATNLSVVRIS